MLPWRARWTSPQICRAAPYVYTVGSDGELESCTADFDLDLVLGLPVTETENAQITAKLQMDMQMDVNATGDDVRISYPSFSNFEDLTPGPLRR